MDSEHYTKLVKAKINAEKDVDIAINKLYRSQTVFDNLNQLINDLKDKVNKEREASNLLRSYDLEKDKERYKKNIKEVL
jgi:hypothetical protein